MGPGAEGWISKPGAGYPKDPFNLTYLPCRFNKYGNDTNGYNINSNNNDNNNDNNDNTDNKNKNIVNGNTNFCNS